jgi:hypothetical protein
MTYALGPIKPRKKPKPKKVTLFDEDGIEVYGWLDCSDSVALNVEIFACIDEETPIFEKAGGVYTDQSGNTITIIEGIIDEISS